MNNNPAELTDVIMVVGVAALVGVSSLWLAVFQSLRRHRANCVSVFFCSHMIALGIYGVTALLITCIALVAPTQVSSLCGFVLQGQLMWVPAVFFEIIAAVLAIRKCAKIEIQTKQRGTDE